MMQLGNFRYHIKSRKLHYNGVPYRMSEEDEAILYFYIQQKGIWCPSSFTLASLHHRYTLCPELFNFDLVVSDEIWNKPINPKSRRYT